MSRNSKSGIFGLLLPGIIVALLFFFIALYLSACPWNFGDHTFWWIIIGSLAVFCMISFIRDDAGNRGFLSPWFYVITLLAPLVLWVILATFSSKIINVGAYRSAVAINNSELSSIEVLPNITQADDLPIVDVVTAQRLGDRQMGQMEKYLSQYEVGDNYVFISYQGEYYRLAALEYGGFYKWFNSRNIGVPGYVLINVHTQEAKLVELEKGMKYVPSAYFGSDLKRHLKASYPGIMFGDELFEIDEDGTPFYIVSIMRPTALLLGAKVQVGVALVNAITGESSIYKNDEVPEWVDNVYSNNYLMSRLAWNYDLIHGVFNFSSRDIRKTSFSFDKSQYFEFADQTGHVQVYTGITSAGKDESNIGFVLMNKRTGNIDYFSSPGAEESSAQSSAKGLVQQYYYSAGPAMLVNVNSVETYFLTLKDAQLLVKKYAFVNKSDYNLVVVEDSVELALRAYSSKLSGLGIIDSTAFDTTGTIEMVATAVESGNTIFIFRLVGYNQTFVSNIDINVEQSLFLTSGKNVNITFTKGETDDVLMVTSISIE